jgi:hypothetical protein
VDIDDGKLGREVTHNGRQGEAEAPSSAAPSCSASSLKTMSRLCCESR